MRHVLFITVLASLSAHADPLTAPSTLPGSGVSAPAITAPAPPMSPAPGVRAFNTPQQTQRLPASMQGGVTDRCSLRPDALPHIGKLKDRDTPAVVFQNRADLFGANVAQVQSPARHLAPGDTFELSGACFGNEAGSVDIRWAAATVRAGDPMSARLAPVERRYTAEIDDWREGKIIARVPADMSGLAPGVLNLSVRAGNGESVSNSVSTSFWPIWNAAHNARQTKAFVQLLTCEASTPALRSVCRGGTQTYQPEADFNYPDQGEAAHNTVAAAHACRAAQGCNTRSTDRYRIEAPAWVIPIVSFWRDGNSHQKHGGPVISLYPENNDAPLSKPRSYLLNIAWSVEKPQETLVYRMDIETVMPRGLEPAADLIKTRTSAPGGLPGGLSGGARPKLKDLQR